MRPIHDLDAIVLMATMLTSKRRPAELIEIVAAADLIQGAIPFPEKLEASLQRLSASGLIAAAVDGGFTLSAIAQDIMSTLPKKAAAEDLIEALKGTLATYSPTGKFPLISLTLEELGAAIRAHKTTRKAPGKNLLMPKPKVDRHFKVEGRWRRVPGKR